LLFFIFKNVYVYLFFSPYFYFFNLPPHRFIVILDFLFYFGNSPIIVINTDTELPFT
jgi:hypothetical protein